MARMTKYLQSKLINHTLGKQAWMMPAATYLMLLESDPGELGVQTAEMTADGYARQILPAHMTLSASGLPSVNSDAIQFGPAVGAWPKATHGMIVDAATAGNGLFYGPLTDGLIIADGEYLSIDPGLLIVSMD